MSSAAEEELVEQLRRAGSSGRRLPDFFIVGHAKSGTTALYEMLQSHPQVFMPAVKEPEFLARAPYDARAQASKEQRPNPLPYTLETYLSLFEPAGAEQLAGEASTEYLRASFAAGRIAELNPDARIVAILREPASFLRSLHLQLLQVGVESESDFERAVGLERDRRRGEKIPRDSAWPRGTRYDSDYTAGAPALLYSDHVRYVEQLRPYHEHFGRERVLTLIYDDFRRDNEGVVRQVLRFLGVDDTLEIRPSEANPTLRVRSRRADKLVNAISVGRGPLAHAVNVAAKAVSTERLRRRALHAAHGVVVEREPRAPAEEFMLELRRRFKGEVVAASEYLQRDLVGLWGYDELT